jgi:hypothetical protein
LSPRTLGPMASTLTTRPPRRVEKTWTAHVYTQEKWTNREFSNEVLVSCILCNKNLDDNPLGYSAMYSRWSTLRYIPEGCHIHTRRRENLKSHICNYCFFQESISNPVTFCWAKIIIIVTVSL